jgi:prepilin-type N-terminal cleavage/methylation domain-containing protein
MKRNAGFTLIELMIYLMIAGVVMGAVVKLMLSQTRSYANQRGLTDVRETVRSAGALIAWELRHAGAGRSPFVSLGAQSVTLRSIQGTAVVCAKVSTPSYFRVGLWGISGDILATSNDSALIWHSGKQVWGTARAVQQVGTAAGLGVPLCTWAGKVVEPSLVVQVAAPTRSDSGDVVVGALFRTFRDVTYSVIPSGGRSWLGRQVGAGAAELLTGPLIAPGGLTFAYWDTLGATMVPPGNPAAVGVVQVTLRAQSLKMYRNLNSRVVGYRQDSLTTKVLVRR